MVPPPEELQLAAGVQLRWWSTAAEVDADAAAVRAIALSPNGSRMAVAAGPRVLLFDASVTAECPEPSLLATLKAHKDAAVTALDWSPDGQRFASAAEDGKVVVWSDTGQGLLKYAHQVTHGPVLQLAFEPSPPHRLCSLTARDVALWTPGAKAVRKQRFDDDAEKGSTVARVAWSPGGGQLAVAFADGCIALWDAPASDGGGEMKERGRINSGSNSSGAELSMAWVVADALVVGRSGGELAVYGDVRQFTQPLTVPLGSDPVLLRPLPQEDAVLMAGADGSLTCHGIKDGNQRRTLTTAGSAVTAVAAAPPVADDASWLLALGTGDGRLGLLAIEPLADATTTATGSKRPQEALEAVMAAGRWDDALALVASADIPGAAAPDVLRRQARWHMARQEWRAAVEALVAAGEPLRAMAVVEERVVGDSAESSWWPARLLELARSVDVGAPQGREAARACARLLAAHDDDDGDHDSLAPMVREAFLRLGEVSGLMAHLSRWQRWREVGVLARERPGQFEVAAFVPYAGWLAAERGRVDEAVAALLGMGGGEEARRLLTTLVHNTVVEGRFEDAAYGHWVLAVEALHQNHHQQQQDPRQPPETFGKHSALADLYFAYRHVHAQARQPFTALAPHTLLHAASFVLHALEASKTPPPGVSRVRTLYVLATQAERLGAHATAAWAYDALAALHLPPAWRDAVDLRRLELRAQGAAAVTDPAELLPLCYRCGLRNLLLPTADTKGDSCQGCGHSFVRSLLTLEVLPLVEFAPDPVEVPSAAQALALLKGAADDEDGEDEEEGARRFNACVARALEQQAASSKGKGTRRRGSSASAQPAYAPVLLGARDLRTLRREEVFVVHGRLSSGAHERGLLKQEPAKALVPCRFYRNVLHPDVPLALSQPAGRFCGEEAFEAAWLLAEEERAAAAGGDEDGEAQEESKWGEGPSCPFSRVRIMGDYGSV